MIEKRVFPAVLIGLATLASGAFAVFIAIDSVRVVARNASPLPWLDAWATFKLLQVWIDGIASPAAILFAQHNEHRILVPRLLFFADIFWLHGLGQVEVVAIFLVQALHTALFLMVLGKARPVARGRWAVGGVVAALMFSLTQAENFSSGFQLTFVGVFVAATASFLFFARAAARPGQQGAALACSFAAALISAFTMANGILAGFVLVALALLARQGWRVTLACAVWAIAIGIVYFHNYQAVEQDARLVDAVSDPVNLASYVTIYLGSVLGTTLAGAGTLGLIGIVAAAAATIRVGTARPVRPTSLMLVGVMLFVGASAAITASGRVNYSLHQALSSRYVTASVTFWCAQLCFWWTDPPGWPARKPLSLHATRAAVAVLGIVLSIAVGEAQSAEKPALWIQNFKQRDATNLLLLGLDDPAVVGQAAWSDDDVQDLLPMLRERRLSIFGGPDADAVGHPIDRRGSVVAGTCTGTVTVALADPRLGPDGARVSGTAMARADHRQIRQILLTDEHGIVVGLGSGGIPGADASAWRGYATASVGQTLRAYGVLDPERLCAVGSAPIAAGTARERPPNGP